MSLSLLVYCSAFVIVLWIIGHWLLMPKPIPGIPYNALARYMPWGDMGTLGIYIWITGEVFRWFSLQCLNHKSPLMQLFVPSWSMTHPTLLLADLREIEDIMTRRVGEIDRADMMHTWFGVIVPKATLGMKSKNINFREQRRLWSVMVNPRFVEEVVAERFWDVATRLAGIWKTKADLAGHDLAFQAHEDVKFATLDGIWKICMGSELGLQNAIEAGLQRANAKSTTWSNTAAFTKAKMPEFYSTFERLLMILDWVMQGISPRVYRWFFEISGMLPRAIQEKDELFDHYIAASRQRAQHDFTGESTLSSCTLDQIFRKDLELNAGKAVGSEAATDSAIRDEMLELLITGHETTTSSISWALKYLTDNPNIQDHLRSSLRIAFSRHAPLGIPSAKEISNTSLPYLDAVIAETLRQSSIAPVSFRETVTQCNILGHTIPAGTPIILVTAGPSYRSPQMPQTPEYLRSKSSQAKVPTLRDFKGSSLPQSSLASYDPSRWLRDDGSFNSDAVHSLPFSAGPRGCFGKKIALLEIKIMLVVLIMRFEFPRLRKGLSRYGAKDGLNRRPICCYVMPKIANSAMSWEKMRRDQCVLG